MGTRDICPTGTGGIGAVSRLTWVLGATRPESSVPASCALNYGAISHTANITDIFKLAE